MEKILNTTLQKHIIIVIAILDIISIIGISLGSVRWFHFPYLFFLDEWHFLWATVALTCGLFFSQIVLDRVSYLQLSPLILSESEKQLTLEFNQLLIQLLFGILGIILLELVMILWGISSALRGLVNLGIGFSCLWSSRLYWITLFQAD